MPKPDFVRKPFSLEAELNKEIDIDEEPLRFGRYEGKTPEQVSEVNPSYICWLYENVRPAVVSEELALACYMDSEEEYNELSF